LSRSKWNSISHLRPASRCLAGPLVLAKVVAALSTVLALGLAACSMPVKILEADVPPEQYPDMNCDALNTERTRLLAVRTDLNVPTLSSKTDAEREAELTQVNGKLYAIAKVRSDKSCPAVATASPSSVVR
jgi:hypothetical protein